mmetsp:Transcript_1184/g.2318  ORF Transcript_1184/g.2318 Transcript_1184/m.2318 type:complete len:94 (-) Transcript_1184:34-315(-)
MPTYVYAVVYSPSSEHTEGLNFLLFLKNDRGYFMCNREAGPNDPKRKIYPHGIPLNGGGKFAFNGGQFDKELDWQNDQHIKSGKHYIGIHTYV